jgi:glycerol uptake facilitator-like aquaporin
MADTTNNAEARAEEERGDADKSEWEGIIMEAIATMIYVFVCCGVVASTANVTFDELNSPRLVVISLAQGLSYSSLIYLTTVINKYGPGYLNPAITLAIMLTNSSHGRYQWGSSGGKAWMRGVLLIIAQSLGGCLGAVLVLATIPNSMKGEDVLGVPALNFGSTFTSGFIFEAFGTFFLSWVVMTNTCRSRSVISKNVTAPMAIGLATVALNIFAFPFTGASFNPVRAVAPMLVGWSWSVNFLLYILAPIAGALVGVLVYILAFTHDDVKFGLSYDAKDD